MDDEFDEYDEGKSYHVIFEAPDYASLMKHRTTQVSRDYTQRMQSLVKAAVLYTIRQEAFTDAAALLEHGDEWAHAAGDVADVSDRARKYMDIVTAPDSPFLAFAMLSMTIVSQLARNHAGQVTTARENRRASRRKRKEMTESGIRPEGAVTWTIPVIKRTVSLRFKVSPKAILSRVAAVFQGTTTDPNKLAWKVFSDEKLIKALATQGIVIKQNE